MAQYFGIWSGQQTTNELKKSPLRGQADMVAGDHIQKAWYPQDTKKLKKDDHRRKDMSEDEDCTSLQTLKNQINMKLPAGNMTNSLYAQPSTLNRPATQRTDQLRKDLSRLSHQELVDAYADCMLERETEQTKNLSLYNEAEQSRQKVLDLEKRLAGQESVVREAQESVFALMASNTSMAENDDKICSRLRIIRMQWKNFAKKWASKSMADIRDEEDHSIRRLVNAWVAPDEDQSHDGIWAIGNNRKAPSILLNTVLAHFISEKIIGKPFTAAYNLKESAETLSYDDSIIMKSLDELYAIKIKEDDRAAHRWRSQTVSFLNLQQPGSISESPTSQEALNQRLEFYKELAHAFECSDAKLLYDKCTEEEKSARLKHLMDLFCSTGDLFSKLWSQRVYIKTTASSFLLKKPFAISMDDCEPHAAHKLEENDNSKDGMPIQMVVEPGILAYGNEQGESYEVSKVWGKAVVWLSSSGNGSKAPCHTSVLGAAQHGPQPAGLA